MSLYADIVEQRIEWAQEQFVVELLNYWQEKVKDEILECLRHQFRDGHAVITWYPYDDTLYSDQSFWISLS